jgi:hypothetical protein
MKKIDWNRWIQNYKVKPKEYPMEYANWIEPYSKELAKVYEKGEIINKPIREEVIIEVESKLNVTLPPSYIEFLKYSNGLLLPDTFTNILPLENVDWFYTLNQEWVDIWGEDEVESSDEKYFIYGKEQDTVWMRNRYLKTALQISDSTEGDVLLLNPEVKFGEEWEAWWFSNSLPGALRFKSFKELLQYLLTLTYDDMVTEEELDKIAQKDKELLKSMEHNIFDDIINGMKAQGLTDKEIGEEFYKELSKGL